jgi:uncharacterized protein
MTYIIDGHNLIPKIPGLSLSSINDEIELVERLQEYCRRRRKQAEVYFDGAPAGFQGRQRFGNVKVHFVREGIPADAAIIKRIEGLGKRAKDMVVVTSDRQILANVRHHHAQTLTSEEFARLMAQESTAPDERATDSQEPVSTDDIDYWLKRFKDQQNDDKQSKS